MAGLTEAKAENLGATHTYGEGVICVRARSEDLKREHSGCDRSADARHAVIMNILASAVDGLRQSFGPPTWLSQTREPPTGARKRTSDDGAREGGEDAGEDPQQQVRWCLCACPRSESAPWTRVDVRRVNGASCVA